jgi:ABC-type branched-subunit amino acid transport system substrate-binding protein
MLSTDRSIGRGILLLLVALLVASACSGTRRPAALATDGDRAADGGGTSATGGGGAPADSSDATATTAATGPAGGTTGPAASGGTTGGAAAPNGGAPAANLFSAADDRIGLTDTTIDICAHAALQLGSVFNATAADFTPYWDQVNANGGIYGRKVRFAFTDDQYTPQGGTQAAQQCKAKNPFVMVGGIGFDTAPAVRQFAEQNDMLYLSSFATESDVSRYRRSFSFVPSIERFGLLAGQYAAKQNPGKRFGVVWRNSPNWQGGRDQFRAAVERAGGTVVADLPVEKDQGDYTNTILSLKRSGAQVVLGWVNVLEFAQLETQAVMQGYRPQWVVAGFNLVTDTLGHDIDGTRGPAAIGVWVTPPFPGDPGNPYEPQIQQMRDAYQRYRPQSADSLTDTHWQFWLFSMGLHRLLLDCGRDCSRNRLAGMLLAGYHVDEPPGCPVDFRKGGGRLGGFALDVYTAVPAGSSARWSSTVRCAEGF